MSRTYLVLFSILLTVSLIMFKYPLMGQDYSKDRIVDLRINKANILLKLKSDLDTSIFFDGHKKALKVTSTVSSVVHVQQYLQETEIDLEHVQLHHDELTVPGSIMYFDEKGELEYSFDIDKHNPYYKLSDSLKIRPYYYNAEGTMYKPAKNNSAVEPATQCFVHTETAHLDQNSAIAYRAYFVTDEGAILKVESTILVLDITGEVIFEHEVESLISMPTVDTSSKFLVFSLLPVETVYNAGVKDQSDGFQIWNITYNECVYKEENKNAEMWISTPSLEESTNIIRLRYTFPFSDELGDKLYLFDADSAELFVRTRSREERDHVSREWFRQYRNYRNVLSAFSFTTKKN